MNKFYKTSYAKTLSINQILKNKKQIKKQLIRNQETHLNINNPKIDINLHLINHNNQINLQNGNVNNIGQKFHLENRIQIDSQLLFSKHEIKKKKLNEEDKKYNKQDQFGRINYNEIKTRNHHSLSKSKNFNNQDKLLNQKGRQIQKNTRILDKIQKRKEQNKTETRFYQPHQENNLKIIKRPHTKQETRNKIISNETNNIRPQTSKGTRKTTNLNTIQRLISLENQNQIDIIISTNQKQKYCQKNIQNIKTTQNNRHLDNLINMKESNKLIQLKDFDKPNMRQTDRVGNMRESINKLNMRQMDRNNNIKQADKVNKRKYNFHTNLDDQFLSLFAN